MCYPRKYPLKDFMNIATRTRRLIATSLLFVGLAASLSHAQTPSITIVNGVSCTSAHAVSVTYAAGALNIITGGCGTVTVLPPPTSPPSITSLSVLSGARGAAVHINGANLAGASVTIGGASANAANNSGTQIITTVPGNATVGAGSIVVTTSVSPAATFPFTVNSPPPPVITLVSPASGQVGTIVTITGTGLTGASVTIGGVAATIAASSSTSITTTVPATAPVAAGNVVVTANGVAVSSAFTVTATVAGDVSSDGIPLPNPSKLAFTIPPFRNGLKGAGQEINAYAMNPARCSTIPALTRSWQHNITLDDYKLKNAFDFFSMQGGESMSYKFTVGNVDAGGGFIYNDAANAVVRPTFISITSEPCVFDVSKLVVGPNRDPCYQTATNGNSIGWINISGANEPAMCKLQKSQTYYLNIRFQDGRPASEGGTPTQDSCVSGNCGGILQVL